MTAVNKEDIIIQLNVNVKSRTIAIETKGIFSTENSFFFEKMSPKDDFNEQLEKFVDSTVNLWKIAFMKQNEFYRESLYKRKLIGYKSC